MQRKGNKKQHTLKTPLQKSIQSQAAPKSAVPNQSDVKVSFSVKPPPRIVKSVKDLIYWEYAKLIAVAAGLTDNYGFIMNRFKNLKAGKMQWKDADEDAKNQLLRDRACIYCGSISELSIDHIIPRSCGGPDIPANTVLACKHCNSSKGAKSIFEWCYVDKKEKTIPLQIWKRYLKLVWDFHVLHRTLDKVDLNADGKLDLLDLSAIFRL